MTRVRRRFSLIGQLEAVYVGLSLYLSLLTRTIHWLTLALVVAMPEYTTRLRLRSFATFQ